MDASIFALNLVAELGIGLIVLLVVPAIIITIGNLIFDR